VPSNKINFVKPVKCAREREREIVGDVNGEKMDD